MKRHTCYFPYLRYAMPGASRYGTYQLPVKPSSLIRDFCCARTLGVGSLRTGLLTEPLRRVCSGSGRSDGEGRRDACCSTSSMTYGALPTGYPNFPTSALAGGSTGACTTDGPSTRAARTDCLSRVLPTYLFRARDESRHPLGNLAGSTPRAPGPYPVLRAWVALGLWLGGPRNQPVACQVLPRSCPTSSLNGYDPATVAVSSAPNVLRGSLATARPRPSGGHRERRSLGAAGRCVRRFLGLLVAGSALTLALTLPCSASPRNDAGGSAPRGSTSSLQGDPTKVDLLRREVGPVPSLAGLSEPGGDGASVLATFHVFPRSYSYSLWSTTTGGGYQTGTPILVRSGDTDVPVGYKLYGGGPSTVSLSDSGAGVRVFDFTVLDPSTTGALISAFTMGVLAPASAADAIVDRTNGLPGVTDARGWIAHGNGGQGDLLLSVAFTGGEGHGEAGDCFWATTGGPSGKSLSDTLAGGGYGAVAIAYLAQQFLRVHPGDRLDHGLWRIAGSNTNDPGEIGHYVCGAYSTFSVTLTPELVTRPGCLRTRPQPGATCNASVGPGDWSPAGTYSLNLQGSVLFY